MANHFSAEDMHSLCIDSLLAGFYQGADATCVIIEDTLERMEIVEQKKIKDRLQNELQECIEALMESFGVDSEGEDET